MPSILFLCTGNQIRSPFTAAYFQNLLAEHNETAQGWTIDSAGTWAAPNQPIDPVLQKLAPNWAVNFEHHKTKQVDRKLLAEFDLILVMEKGQREALHYEFPQCADKVFMLTEICTAPYDFPDPQGLEIIQAEKCLQEIAAFLNTNYEKIVQKAKSME